LISSDRSDIIQLVLKDGHYYEDIEPKDSREKKKFPFAKAQFDTYTINIELPDNQQDLEEERNVRTDKMKNISRLVKDIDSLKDNNVKVVTAFSKNITSRMGAFMYLGPNDSLIDSPAAEELIEPEIVETVQLNDSLISQEQYTGDIVSLFKVWQQEQLYSSAKSTVSNILNSILGKKEELQRRYKIYNMHILSLHKKYALAFSCIILFFVGAPLGAIIRKGGLGLPMVIAIVLFLAYYFIGVFAGNYAKEGNIHPILGAWLSTLIMLPLSIYLTKRATADRGLMDFGHLTDRIRRLFKGIKLRIAK
ncbi:MAG: LptF/LptG family permease, partial [Eudoraea sp.]|nr:LptF/LptG family permease [Eudoraea sp.]